MSMKGALLSSRAERVLEALLRGTFFNLLARAFGYFKNVAIAVLIGFGAGTDAFFMALGLLGIFLIFVDMFDSLGVPNLVRARMESEEEFKRLSRLLFSFTVSLSLFITLFALLLVPLVIKVAIGFEEERMRKTLLYLYLLIPYLFFSFYFHHFSAVLRSIRRFSPFFFGNFLFSFLSFLMVSVGLYLYKDPIILPISWSIAQALATVYIVYTAREHIGFSYYVDERVKEMLKQGGFLLALYGVFHLFILVDKAFASLLPPKSVSALHFGLALAYGIKAIFNFENIVITSLSEVKADFKKLNFYLSKTLLLSLPLSLAMFILSPLIVKLLFGYGAFSHLDAELTSEALRYYSLSLAGFFIWPILYRVFQIKGRLVAVFFVAIAGVLINLLANYLFVVGFGLGIKGIALGTFLAYVGLCGLGYYWLWKNV